jgi:hypothetical protein
VSLWMHRMRLLIRELEAPQPPDPVRAKQLAHARHRIRAISVVYRPDRRSILVVERKHLFRFMKLGQDVPRTLSTAGIKANSALRVLLQSYSTLPSWQSAVRRSRGSETELEREK